MTFEFSVHARGGPKVDRDPVRKREPSALGPSRKEFAPGMMSCIKMQDLMSISFLRFRVMPNGILIASSISMGDSKCAFHREPLWRNFW